MERLGGAGLGGAEQLFQLGPGLLDRIVGAEDGGVLPMASRSGFMHAPPAAGAGITACHLRGHSALVEEDQLLRRDGLEALEELFPPLAVLFAVAFDGVERLFFSR